MVCRLWQLCTGWNGSDTNLSGMMQSSGDDVHKLMDGIRLK
jgi:hypothetical protein